MALGEALGVRGTPMMVTAKGTIFPGYMPAKRLAAALASCKTQNLYLPLGKISTVQ
jgi:protein-disulfide isomerase